MAQEDRKAFAKRLPGARFFPLDSQSKRPLVKLKGRRLAPKPPTNPQYGIALPPRILVIDVDTHTDDKIDPQVSAMSHLLGLDLTKTLTVTTASGGRHFYVRVPEGIDLEELPNGSIRHLDYILRTQPGVAELLDERPLDTDFKLGKSASVSYTVGAGSYNASGSYDWIDLPILEAPLANLETIVRLKLEHGRARLEQRQERAKVKARELGLARRTKSAASAPALQRTDQLTSIPGARLRDLQRSLNRMVDSAKVEGRVSFYHSRRAHVFYLMQCCFSDEAIAQACSSLKIDWDTYADAPIGYGELLMDIVRLRESGLEASFHGVVCGKGRFNAAAASSGSLDEGLQKLGHRVATRTLSRRQTRLSATSSAIVLNTTAAEEALASITRRSSAQFANSMAILRDLVQPIINAGADRVVMSREFIASEFGLTDSQTAKALGALRRAGILSVRDRQRTGAAPTYGVETAFVDRAASEVLSLERQFKQLGEDVFPSLIMDYEAKSITEAYTGELVSGTVVSSHRALSIAQRYSVDEAKRREEIASGEYSIRAWERGLDSHEDNLDVVDPIRDLFSNPERVADLVASGTLREMERKLDIWSRVEEEPLSELASTTAPPLGGNALCSSTLPVSHSTKGETLSLPGAHSWTHEELGVLVV